MHLTVDADGENTEIVVMDEDDLNEKFLTVGYQRRKNRVTILRLR